MTTAAPGLGPAGLAQHVAAALAATPALDAEKLDVYRVALEAQAQAAALVPEDRRVLRDQLERASLSVILNIAEGAGRRSRKDKARHYAIARGSAMESAAIVDVIARRKLGEATACASTRGLYVRVVQMLTKLDAALTG
jgi:four helix bundle protein